MFTSRGYIEAGGRPHTGQELVEDQAEGTEEEEGEEDPPASPRFGGVRHTASCPVAAKARRRDNTQLRGGEEEGEAEGGKGRKETSPKPYSEP